MSQNNGNGKCIKTEAREESPFLCAISAAEPALPQHVKQQILDLINPYSPGIEHN